ncbi:MAG: hypothetical protein U1F50_03320 [Rubrivivax sp.]
MERRLSLIRRALPRRLARLVLGLLVLRGVRAAAEEHLVLVVGQGSRIAHLGSLELHKLYLGLAVVVDGQRLRPLRNVADPLMRQVFFQSIVSMSEAVYDRRMLALVLQQRGSPPATLDSTAEVFDTLAQDPNAVSFAWAAEAERDPRVRVLRVLWHR